MMYSPPKFKTSLFSRKWNGAHNSSATWIFYFLCLCSHFQSTVSCELDLSYETEAFMPADIHLIYKDPATGVLTHERLQAAKLLPGKNEEMTGVVMHVTSNIHEACDPLDDGMLPQEQFIALINHEHCGHEIKLQLLANDRANAVVFYSCKNSTSFQKIELKGNGIPFAVINEERGEWLANLVDSGTRVTMQIGSPSFRYAVPLAVLLLSLFILMGIFIWFISHSILRFRWISDKGTLSKHLCSAAMKVLEKVPVKTVEMDGASPFTYNECCAVCIEPFQRGELIRTLPCTHCFHKICIDPWLLKQRSCPLCKYDILQHFGLVYTGSQESVLEIADEDFRRRRSSFVEHEVMLIQGNRRHSNVRIAISRTEETSPNELASTDAALEHSFATDADAAANISDHL